MCTSNFEVEGIGLEVLFVPFCHVFLSGPITCEGRSGFGQRTSTLSNSSPLPLFRHLPHNDTYLRSFFTKRRDENRDARASQILLEFATQSPPSDKL